MTRARVASGSQEEEKYGWIMTSKLGSCQTRARRDGGLLSRHEGMSMVSDEKVSPVSDEKISTVSDEKISTVSDEEISTVSDEEISTLSDKRILIGWLGINSPPRMPTDGTVTSIHCKWQSKLR